MQLQLVLQAWSGAWGWWLFWTAGSLTAVGLILWLYRYERQLVSAATGRWLLGLRLAVVACLWFTMQQPTLTWNRDIRETGQILVAIDVSDSMATQDLHAAPGEKLRWARALGLIGQQASDERLDAWQKSYDAGQEPVWVEPQESADPARREKLAQLRKKMVEQALQDVAQIPRREFAQRLLDGPGVTFLSDLQKLAPVKLVLFGGQALGTDETQLPQAVTHPPVSLRPELSDLSQPLSQALSASDAGPVLGVIVLSDGRDTGGHDATALAARLRQLPTPVFTVPLGSIHRPKDLAVASLEAPQTVFKDDHPVLKAYLATAGFEGQPITVTLQRAGGETVPQTITPTGPTAQVEFPLVLPGLGRHEYTVTLPQLPGETRPDNNSQGWAVTVVDDKVHVLVLEGEARWEFRYLDNALQRDERVDAASVVFEQPYLRVLNETFFPRKISWPADKRIENSALANADLVIIGDVAPESIPPLGWEVLEKFVSEEGGTLVFSAGKRYMPLQHTHPAVPRLLPVQDLAPWLINGVEGTRPPAQRGFKLNLTAEGAAEPMFQFDTDPVRNREIWSRLPGHMWGLIGTAKPGASVLASAQLAPGMLADLQAERNQAAIVQQYYGQGQVLWIGIDSTWRWRHLVGDAYHHRFWGQLGRWAAKNKATAGNEFVKFGPDRGDVRTGEDVTLRARWTAEFLKRFPRVEARVELRRTTDPPNAIPFSVIDLKPVTDRPQIYEARTGPLPTGSYQLKLVTQQGDLGPKEVTTTLYVHQPPSVELTDLSAQPELLRQIAQLTQGQLISPEKMPEILEQLHDPFRKTSTREELPLWSHWSLVLVFFALLTTEWVIRKMNGLP